jgi:chromate transporter
MSQIPTLFRVFSYPSLLTVGGMAAFPEMKDLTVDIHEWLRFPQLVHLCSVGQMVAGLNSMIVRELRPFHRRPP